MLLLLPKRWQRQTYGDTDPLVAIWVREDSIEGGKRQNPVEWDEREGQALNRGIPPTLVIVDPM